MNTPQTKRGRKPGRTFGVPIPFTTTPVQAKRLREYAATRMASVSQIIREAIDLFLIYK